MTLPPPANNDPSQWQTKYKAKDAHAADGKRSGAISMGYSAALFISSLYVTAYLWFYYAATIVDWVGKIGILLLLGLVAVVLALITSAVRKLLFQAAISFFDRLYERDEFDSDAAERIKLRFSGIPPSPPPLRRFDAFKYPFVLIRDGRVDPKKDWIQWLGGPARLLIFDGNALYVERGNKFSRVIGPSNSLPFLDATERVRAVVDLHPHVLVKPAGIKAWTKDGILVQMDVRLECQIGVEGMTEATSKGLLYPYGPISVKKAVEKTPVRFDQEKKCLTEIEWPDKVWGSVQGVLATYIFSHTLDELFLAESGADQVHSRDVTSSWLENLNAGLREGGTRLLSLQITNVRPVDPQVNEKRVKYWEAIKQSVVTISEGEAKAHGILAHEKARAQAERDLINAIVDGLGSAKDSYDDQLVLALSGILDQSLKDNDLGLYMPGETLGSLQKLRELLKLS
jgi:hypothetical protein